MSRENDRPQEPPEEPSEEDSYEGETRLRQRPRSPRDAYDEPPARPRQYPRQAGAPRETGRDRPGPHDVRPGRRPGPSRPNDPRQAYDAYGRPRPGTRSPGARYENTTEPPRQHPRQSSDRREQRGPYDEVDERYQQRPRMYRHSRDEVYARLRQRPRQPPDPRDEEYDAYAQQRRRPLVGPEDEKIDRQALRPGRMIPPPQQPARRKRRVWSTLLIGCIGGIVTILLILGVVVFVLFRNIPIGLLGIGTSTFTQNSQQPLPISTNTAQLQISNRVGNISMMVDPNVTTATLSYVKKVQARSSSDANAEFGRISVNVHPGSDPSILTVTATEPETSSASDRVDMTIVLPASVVNSPSGTTSFQPFILNASTTIGDVSAENYDGVLTLTDDTGNISVHGLLTAGSCLQTRIGNVTFAGFLDTTTSSSINPCSANTTNTPTPGSTQPWFSMKCGTGNIDVTLKSTPSPTNVYLNANIYNKGKINSDFPLNIQQNPDGSASYDGPLIANTSPTALLALTVNIGNISLHKA